MGEDRPLGENFELALHLTNLRTNRGWMPDRWVRTVEFSITRNGGAYLIQCSQQASPAGTSKAYRCLGQARRCLGKACKCLGKTRRCLGKARRCLGKACKCLGKAWRYPDKARLAIGMCLAFRFTYFLGFISYHTRSLERLQVT